MALFHIAVIVQRHRGTKQGVGRENVYTRTDERPATAIPPDGQTFYPVCFFPFALKNMFGMYEKQRIAILKIIREDTVVVPGAQQAKTALEQEPKQTGHLAGHHKK